MKTFIERFMDKTIPEPNTGCLLWTGDNDTRGYGQVWLNGRRIGAHRVAFEIANGPIPPNTFICHRCDTPACVNPDHLFAGSHSDNMRDMTKKGRGRPWGAFENFCKRGHEYTPENTGHSGGQRYCRKCSDIRSRAARMRRNPNRATTP